LTTERKKSKKDQKTGLQVDKNAPKGKTKHLDDRSDRKEERKTLKKSPSYTTHPSFYFYFLGDLLIKLCVLVENEYSLLFY
jgi:hypothetical protein